jgi:tRNA dimethylallyltransferase
VGKTGVAMEMARQFQTSIISADSRQCYTEMNIGVARPSPEQLQSVRHYFVACRSIQQPVNAAIFEKWALDWAEEIFARTNVLVLAGGTGLYVKAFLDGLNEIPPVDPAIRENIRSLYAERGMNWLEQEVQKTDPLYAARGESKNPHRLLRALEVRISAGRSILSFQSSLKNARPFRTIRIGLLQPNEQLKQQIRARVDQMMACGLLEEVRQLLPYQNLRPLQTVGYTELFSHLEGRTSLEAAVELIKGNTWQYARRQLTWFRKDDSIQWTEPGNWKQLQKITES